MVCSDDSGSECGVGTPQEGLMAVAGYRGIYHRFRHECGSSRQLCAGTELYRLGLWTVRVHRQIIFGSRETHSRVYRSGSTDGDAIAGTHDLAGGEGDGLPVSLSRNCLGMVLLSVCYRIYTESLFPGACRAVQNVECGKNHLSAAFISE